MQSNNQTCYNRKIASNQVSSCGKMRNTIQCGMCRNNTCKCNKPITPSPSTTYGQSSSSNYGKSSSSNYGQSSSSNYGQSSSTNSIITNNNLQNIPTQQYQIQPPPVLYNSLTTQAPVEPEMLTSLGRTGLQAIPENLPNVPPIIDSSDDNAPYNIGDYPPFDSHNQQVGVYTRLDQIHDATNLPPYSDNAMDPNWGGTNYTIKSISTGKYADNEIYKPMNAASKNNTNSVQNPLYGNSANTPEGAQFLSKMNGTKYNPNVI